MPSPGVALHLLVPGAHETVLAATGDTAATLPVIAPPIGPNERLVTALERYLRESWGLKPVILETHVPPQPDGDRHVGLGVLASPPNDWRPPGGLAWHQQLPSLPDPVAARARTWIREFADGGTPPLERPPWSRFGWMEQARAWIDARLRESSRAPTGRMTLARLWSISAMLRIPTDSGDAWFKAVYPHFGHEPAVTGLLAESVAGLVPDVLATDAARGWLLLAGAGEPLSRVEGADHLTVAAIAQLAAAQEATRERLADFAALGCPHRPLAALPDSLASAMADFERLGGAPVAADRVARAVEWVAAESARIERLGFDEVLVHGDFHPGNVLTAARRTRIIDWSDAAISHPIVEIAPWFGEVVPELRPRGWKAWLRALARFGPVGALVEAQRTAYAVSSAYQVVSYAAILRGVEPANRHQLSDGLNGYWDGLNQIVP